MAKIVIDKNQLPDIEESFQSYFVRYRIVSDDSNRFSYWSPIYQIYVNQYGLTSASVVSASGVATINWVSASGVSTYSVWMKWNNDPWFYYGNVSTTSISLNKKVGATSLSVQVNAKASEITGNKKYDRYVKVAERLSAPV